MIYKPKINHEMCLQVDTNMATMRKFEVIA
jgi:hypothetical protein